MNTKSFKDKNNKYKIQWITKWKNDFIKCPSQAWRRFRMNKKVLELYCRWRWKDPWYFKIIDKNDSSNWKFKEIGYGLTKNSSPKQVNEFAEELLRKYISKK
ncbi:MAG: hypothetical protein ACE5ES_00525 [Candidatus Nanoarchaeia archaeon]